MKSEHSSIKGFVEEATSHLGAFYPLSNFIACNAIKGLEDIPFNQAMKEARELFGAKGFLSLPEYRAMFESGRIEPSDLDQAFKKFENKSEPRYTPPKCNLTLSETFDKITGSNLVGIINSQMTKWCAAYLDRTQAQWIPIQKKNLFSFWKELAIYDLSLLEHGIDNEVWANSVSSINGQADQVIKSILFDLGLSYEEFSSYLKQHVMQLPGFASYFKFLEENEVETNILTDYLAIRLHYESVLSKELAMKLYACSDLANTRRLLISQIEDNSEKKSKADDYSHVWQEAYELNYRNKLLSKLSVSKHFPQDNSDCQLVFCIDVRSEPIRREIEKQGSYSTFGFAGFFGMPMRLKELGSQVFLDLCPVLLKPDKNVFEACDSQSVTQKIGWLAMRASILQLKKKLKSSIAGTFGLVEMFGLSSCLPLVTKTLFPTFHQKVCKTLEHNLAGSNNTFLDLSRFSLQDKIDFAQGTVRGIGLTTFAKLIVLCGHHSSSLNNPFASSLDCGACGGNGGAFSARLASQILNDPEVRNGLLQKDIQIPEETIFIAAEHDTSTDLFTFFESDKELIGYETLLTQLKKDLLIAGESVRTKRVSMLPQSSLKNLNHALNRSCDWAQIAPEWGLAGNAAFIAAPRHITKGSDLEGRAFLHSYDYHNDTEKKILELIMTAPMVVAQWINIQYYLSTMDNNTFGSGSKVVHNVLGDFGIMRGTVSDLQIGLPLQSIKSPKGFGHEPMRLMSIIAAPTKAIDAVLEKHPEVRKLVSNNWIRLISLDPDSMHFQEAEDCGTWHDIKYSSKPVSGQKLYNPDKAPESQSLSTAF